MSPEQFMAVDIDNKTDIFAVGLVLCEMITGDIPFANQQELCQKDIEEILEERPSQIPEDVKSIMMKCLRNNANRRYNASELKAVLQEVINRG